jgi:hypothetical protein
MLFITVHNINCWAFCAFLEVAHLSNLTSQPADQMVTGCVLAVTPTHIILFIVNYKVNFPGMSLCDH